MSLPLSIATDVQLMDGIEIFSSSYAKDERRTANVTDNSFCVAEKYASRDVNTKHGAFRRVRAIALGR